MNPYNGSPVKCSGVSTKKLPASKYKQKVYCLSAKTGAKNSAEII